MFVQAKGGAGREEANRHRRCYLVFLSAQVTDFEGGEREREGENVELVVETSG